MDEVAAEATADRLEGVRVGAGGLKVAPLKAVTPEEAEALAERLYALVPSVRITELLGLGRRLDRPGRLLHPPAHGQAGREPACGAHRRAGRCDQSRPHPHGRGLQPGDPSAADLDRRVAPARGDLRARARARHRRAPPPAVGREVRPGHVVLLGRAALPCRGAGRERRRRQRPARLPPRGVVLRPCVGPLRRLPRPGLLPATAGEAAHVIDGLLYHHADTLDVAVHHDLRRRGERSCVRPRQPGSGFVFAPRIPNLGDRRLHTFEGRAEARWPALAPIIGSRVDAEPIRHHWDDVARG